MRVLGIITARGGSKGVPRKNVKLLNGKPLIGYTVESALDSKRLSRVVVSTEDTEIADIAKELGADVPFLRPRELAADTTPTLPVVLHAVETLERMGDTYDAVCLLQPTNPFRRSIDIDACIELLDESGADSVVSVLPVPDSFNPNWVYWQSSDGTLKLSTGAAEPIPRRQDLPRAYHREGSIYLTRREVLITHANLYGTTIRGYEVDPAFSVNIDTPEDWELAEKHAAAPTLTDLSSSQHRI